MLYEGVVYYVGYSNRGRGGGELLVVHWCTGGQQGGGDVRSMRFLKEYAATAAERGWMGDC